MKEGARERESERETKRVRQRELERERESEKKTKRVRERQKD